jgi:hypothetical protein
MKRVSLFAPLVLIVATASTQEPIPAGSREISFHRGRDLATVLEPGDKSVRVVRSVFPPITGPEPNPAREVEALTTMAEAVAQVRVIQKDGAFTADRDWIDSRVTVTVTDLLKESASVPLQTGSRLSFSERGGSLTLQGTLITAIVPWEIPTAIGSDYLVFLESVVGEVWTTLGPVFTFEIVNGRANRLSRVHPPVGIGEAPYEVVRSHVRAAAKLPSRGRPQ